MDDCIFCKILRHELPASFVYEDDLVSVFMDIKPVTPGHLLIVPKVHFEFISEVPEETLGRMFRVSKKINAALRNSGLKCEGVNYFLADGEAAMQEVPHVHLHLIPRFEGDGFGLRFPESYDDLPARAELDANAEKIGAQLK